MIRNLLIVLSIVFALCSCSGFKEVECTGVKGFTVKQLNTSGLTGDILLSIKNPNKFGFSIFKSEFDVTYSGLYLGKARLDKRVKIKANDEQTYAFTLVSSFENLNLADVMKLIAGGAFKNQIEVKGDLKVGKFLYRKKLPVDVHEKIRLK